LVGRVNTIWGKPIDVPIPLYKNPENLTGFDSNARGILSNNGDLFLAQKSSVSHDDILKTLYEKNLVSRGAAFNYSTELPEDFVAVQRAGGSNGFGQSSAYDEFPVYYEQIFDEANAKQPFKFNNSMSEQLDPNNLISYTPDGYDAGIVNEKS